MPIESPFAILVEKLSSYRNRDRTGYSISDLKKAFLQLGQLHSKTRVVQVAGTNGKGSVVHKIVCSLSGSELDSVGQFVSPHVFKCTERIQISGKHISQRDFIRHYNRILCCMEGIHFTFFDTLFLIAYSYFQEEKVDFAIFEAGIGARLDATSLLNPNISVLTTISIDHEDVLGNSLECIAHEKAYVIREKIPIVVGPKATHPKVLKRAFELNAPIYFIEPASDFEEENQLIAKQVLSLLNCSYDPMKLCLNLPCRFKKLQIEDVKVVLDVAHNLEGFNALLHRLKDEMLFFALGFTSKNNMERVLGRLDQIGADYLIMSDNKCGLIELGNQSMSIEEGICEAFLSARNSGSTLCVAGSFYLMERAQQSLQLQSTGPLFLQGSGKS